MEDLFAAIKAGDRERVQALIAGDPAAASARDENGLSAVLTALYQQRRDIAETLLAAGPELDVLDAAATGRLDVLRAEIDANPEALAARSPEGFTPLHLAAFFGGAAAVRLLLTAGAPADADADNPPRVRPIHSATAARDHEAVQALLEAGADPNVQQQGGFTPLQSAAHSDDVQSTELLLRHGADPDLAADDGQDARAMAGPRTRSLLGG